MSNEEYGRLQQSINNAMDGILSSLQVVQQSSKPLKAATSKRKAAVVQ